MNADGGGRKKDDKAPDKPVKLDPAVEAIEDLTMAFRLAEYGRTTKSPEALIAAAGILQRLAPATALKAEVKADDGSVIKPLMLPSFRYESDELLKEAKEMAKGDATVAALADAVAGRKVTRGGLAGPQMIRNIVAAKSHHAFHIPAVPGAPFVISFQSSGVVHVTVSYTGSAKGASANVRVFDQSVTVGRGMLVTPAGAKGTIHVTIRNSNSVPVQYVLGTN